MGPHPAVAAIRLAVRRVLREVLDEHVSSVPESVPEPASESTPDARPVADSAPLVLVACSGGADSMALASALAFEAPRLGVRAGGVTVDHGLQPGSAERAADVVSRLTTLKLSPAESIAVQVERTSTGPEAAAREARYTALDAVADRLGAAAVILGHTRDDQAETVLLGLARGSGTRSLSGMAPVSGPAGRYRRPFLAIDRQSTRRACMVQSLPVWDDPHNDDPAYTRSRVRHEALPTLEKALGKGVIEALARTAQLSRDDADALDSWAEQAERSIVTDAPGGTAAADAAASAGPALRGERAGRPEPATRPVPPTVPARSARAHETAQSPEPAQGSAAHLSSEFAQIPQAPQAGQAAWGESAQPSAAHPAAGVRELDTARLYALPPAVRRRVLRRAAIEAGAPAGSLFARHIEEIDRLVTSWRGQRAINLPGRVEATRQGGRLVIRHGSLS